MKKILTLLLTLLLFITLVGCNSATDEEPVIQEEEVENIIEDTPILGGWQDVEDGTLNDDLKNIFNSALEGLLGANYEPIELLATQVVNGTNYKFLASGTKTTNPIIEGAYNIIVNKSSDGTISLVDIEVVEEKEKKKEVDKSMNYWVVFYNPDGLELDRQAIKYGTTPTYKGEDPIYWDNDYWYRFICWTDKQGNEIKEFTPITGNTYIYAKYEIGGKAKKEEAASASLCSSTDPLYYFTFASYDGWASWQTNFMLYKYNGSGFNHGVECTGITLGGPSSNIEINKWYHSNDEYTFVECTDPSHHEPYGHVCTKTSTYLLHILNVPYDCNTDIYVWNEGNGKYEFVENKEIDYFSFDPFVNGEAWIHTNNADNPGSGSQQECDDVVGHEVTCFVAGTRVLYDLLGNTKNIEDFKVGDQIVSYNVNTNKYYLARVGNVFVHDNSERVSTLADVLLEDGSKITMTPNHPVLTTAGFRTIDNDKKPKLQAGQFAMTINGWTRIKEIAVYKCEPTVTYNLGIIDYDEIVDNDTYDTYVAGGIVVHNLY